MTAKGGIRIIGGRYRGRKIPVMHKQIRPTSDRVRETLFNWLSSKLVDKSCLDLFAGTGILGIEALSRGARTVIFVDHQEGVVSEIQYQISNLQLKNCSVVHSDSLRFLDKPKDPSSFDIIFLDPPFGVYDLQKILDYIDQTKSLNPEGLVYYESKQSLEKTTISDSWDNYRESKAGNVYYGLLTKKLN